MFSEHAVKLATEYLDRTFESDKQPTLVEMLEYVDYFDRLVMTLDEVNAALDQRPSVFVYRDEGHIEFRSSGVERTIGEDDLQRALSSTANTFASNLKSSTPANQRSRKLSANPRAPSFRFSLGERVGNHEPKPSSSPKIILPSIQFLRYY